MQLALLGSVAYLYILSKLLKLQVEELNGMFSLYIYIYHIYDIYIYILYNYNIIYITYNSIYLPPVRSS